MKLSYLSFTVAFCTWQLVATDNTTHASASPGSMKLNFNVSRGSLKRNLARSVNSEVKKQPGEEGALPMELNLERTRYITDLLIGSNRENNRVLVDTGSSDFWVMSSDVHCHASIKKREIASIFNVESGVTDPINKGNYLIGNYGKGQDTVQKPSKSEEPSFIDSFKRADSNSHNITDFLGGTTYPDPGEDSVSKVLHSSADNESNGCTSYGSFNTDDSDTFMYNDTDFFEISYADDTFVKGVWGQDTIIIGNTSVSDLSFAVADETSSNIGVLGLGLQLWERSNQSYENLPAKLKSSGVINKAVYSFYLDKADAHTGAVLFGAVDHAKYEGTLETLPIRKTFDEDEHPTRFQVMINQLTINNESESLEILVGQDYAVLDPSSTFSYFRRSQIRDIVTTLNGQFSSYVGAYVIDCKYKNSESTYDITFTNKSIRVPVSDLVIESSLNSTCYLGVFEISVGSLYVLLGDNILRNAYVVYDLEDNEVHIGQAYYTADEHIEIVYNTVPVEGGQNITRASGRGDSTSSTKNSGFSLNYSPWTCTFGWLLFTAISLL
ncbi:hypothetical protein CORT_0B03810 [Candida orthopsilosis Co 90-125]|uniref:candidapepsin n=1 Tax=Candida orthopsilosis (strain 90-125) TaxID=1136231 RepID=H8X149_CANO9|nr:hypothetical protein CORT_0B03810 [Candida orthopsilosis Co 90-125]CCG22089.1 hypothetical protein CORT_0B03810 [Candida orthopsilosis Co 90-125]